MFDMKVLSVDDVLLIRKLTGKVVEALGGELLEASDGMEALAVLEKCNGNVDLIILDWNMPKMNGYDFLSHIKNDDKFRHIPVIMCTTEGEKDKIIRAIQAGARNYLVKPFSEQDLAKKIMDCLGLGYDYDLFYRCFSDAFSQIIGKIAGTEVLDRYGSGEDWTRRRGVFFGQILVLGQINAVILITMKKETAAKTVSLPAGNSPVETEDEKLVNGIAEMMNMVVAKTRALIAGTNVKWDLEFPCTLAGFIGESLHLLPNRVFMIAKDYRAGDMEVSLSIHFI
jgi:two-component system chemotaxis response regulator CheY